jgi:hypothetical protein
MNNYQQPLKKDKSKEDASRRFYSPLMLFGGGCKLRERRAKQEDVLFPRQNIKTTLFVILTAYSFY